MVREKKYDEITKNKAIFRKINAEKSGISGEVGT